MAKAPPLATGRLPSLRLFSTLLLITLIMGPLGATRTSRFSEQAMLALPILILLADLLHGSRQVVVLVFQYASLTSGVITPTYGGMLAILAVAQVPFTKWLRFILPIYLILFGISAVAIMVAVRVGLN